MFSGIIEQCGIVRKITANGSGLTFEITADFTSELKVDQSVSHNGVCLTVEALNGNSYSLTAIDETLQKSNLGSLREGMKVNLERSLTLNKLIDGHLVQGHVDCTGKLESIRDDNGSYVLEISYPKQYAALLVEKGSVCLNGISLTVFGLKENRFNVAIIPYTWQHTNLSEHSIGDTLNIEFDIVGKYIARRAALED